MRFIDFEQSEISKFCSKSQYTNSVLRQPIKVLYPMSGGASDPVGCLIKTLRVTMASPAFMCSIR